MESDLEFKKLLCCASKTWCRFIGWLQVIVNLATFILFTVGTVSVAIDTYNCFKSGDCQVNENEGKENIFTLIECGYVTVTSFIGTIAGIVLLLGVKKESAKLIQTWTLLEVISLIIIFAGCSATVIGLGFSIVTLVNVIVFIVGIIFITIVRIYYTEMMDRRGDGGEYIRESLLESQDTG